MSKDLLWWMSLSNFRNLACASHCSHYETWCAAQYARFSRPNIRRQWAGKIRKSRENGGRVLRSSASKSCRDHATRSVTFKSLSRFGFLGRPGGH